MFGFSSLISNSLKSSYNTANLIKTCCFSTFTQSLWIHATPKLLAMPMRKKKKLDPILSKARQEKKVKRLWRDCKRLMKLEKQLKPLDEIEIPYHLVDERQKYLRENRVLTPEILDDRANTLQQWSYYRMKKHSQDLQVVDKIEYCQYRALQQLQKASPTLYQKAVEIDESFLPFRVRGPTLTPPIKNYDGPDGEYVDVTKKWDPIVIPDMDKKMSSLNKAKLEKENKEKAEKENKKK